jgi:3-oxoacyl-[acyl-carrier protein] reductase
LESLIRAAADKRGQSYAEIESEWKDKVPMGRFARPEETAGLIEFLLSEKANYITGQNIAVDGGRTGCL